MPRPTPNSFLNDSFLRSRSSMTADMSTSLKVVNIAAVCCASTSRRVIVWRRLLLRTRSSEREVGAVALLVGAVALLVGAVVLLVGAVVWLVGAVALLVGAAGDGLAGATSLPVGAGAIAFC